MSAGILERLRAMQKATERDDHVAFVKDIWQCAADEIERLRKIQKHREAVLALIYDRWHVAKEEQNRHEDDEMMEWAEVARGKAELCVELAEAVRKLTDEP